MDIGLNLTAPRLLIVEEELTSADRLSAALRKAGYRVQNAYNVADALAEEHQRFDLLVINGTMKDRQGAAILDLIARDRHFSTLPVLAVTNGAAMPPSNGLVIQLPSAYTDEELIAKVKQALETPRPLPSTPSMPPVVASQPFGTSPSLTSRTTPPEGVGHITPDDPTQPVQGASMASMSIVSRQQLAELKTLSTLARSISSVLDLNDVLSQVVEASTTLTNAEEGMLLMPDEAGQVLYLRAKKGIDDSSARNFRIKAHDAMVGRVYTTGEPLLIGDRGPQKLKTEYFVKSLLYVPMNFKGRTIGVLGVTNRLRSQVFTEHDQQLLLDLAAHAAIAIENARLYEERMAQNRRLRMLVEASQALNSSLELKGVLSILCQQMIDIIDASAAVVHQANAEGQLRPLASIRRMFWREAEAPTLPAPNRPVLYQGLVKNAYYIVTRGGKTEWKSEEQYLERDAASALVMLPIRPGQQPAPSTGALELYYYDAPPDVNSEFRAKLRGLANQILNDLTSDQPVLSSADLIRIAQDILKESSAAWMVLWAFKDERMLVRLADYGSAASLAAPQSTTVSFPRTMADFVTTPAMMHHVRDANLRDTRQLELRESMARAMLSLPVQIKDKSFGAVTVYSNLESRRFDQRDVDLASALVAQAAIAIENARLYRDLQQSLADLRDAQAQLVQAARLSTMGELAAVVAHQINNPLTTVMVDSELMLQDMQPDNPLLDGLMAINRAGKRAHAVVKRLLSTARRPDASQPQQIIELNATLHNTLELVTTHIERSKIRITTEIDSTKGIMVRAANGLLEDLWLNLFLNARDALLNRQKSTIQVRTFLKDNSINISICDNGTGIQPEHVERIFEPFFTTKIAGEGTGLGLYIGKQIIDSCGGKISVKSRVNEGTCFEISLPVAKPETAKTGEFPAVS